MRNAQLNNFLSLYSISRKDLIEMVTDDDECMELLDDTIEQRANYRNESLFEAAMKRRYQHE